MNLARLTEDHVATFGDYESIFFEGKWHSTGEGLARTRGFAAGLQELGVERGDRVVVLLPNCPEVSISYWAAWRIGAAVTPVIFLLPPPEIRRILENSEAKVAITSPDLLPSLQAAAEGIPTLKHIVCVGEAEGTVPFTDLEKSGEAEMVDCSPDDLAALLYTGGTTGSAKGVMLSHNNLEWTARVAAEASEIKPHEVGLLTLPLSHSFGLHVSIVGALNPSTGVLLRWFDAHQFIDSIEQHKVQRLAVVPAMLQFLLLMPLEERNLSSLSSITSGAAGLPSEVLRSFEERVPSVGILQGYGLTETSPTVAVQPPSSIADGTRKIGSVGPVVPGEEVKIANDDGEPLPPGEVGEITVKGPNVMLGYWRNEEATAEAIRDGWFHTGDVGKVDEDGNLWIVDRKKDLIIRGGFNVFPADVEGIVLKHAGISEAALVGRQSEKWGEEPVLFVVINPGAEVTVEELTAYCDENLAKYKRPSEIRIVTEIPKTPVGKPDKKAMRATL
ncbi:MAG: long-chain acyl-CoA synthetase [Actinomycetota bacterium]|nr:long-chain acyl-CoA synthetase [Actinomycetota bacterium]